MTKHVLKSQSFPYKLGSIRRPFKSFFVFRERLWVIYSAKQVGKRQKRGKRKRVGDETKLFLSFCSGGGGRWEWNVSFSLDPTKRKPKRNLPLPPAWLAFLRGDPNLPFLLGKSRVLRATFFGISPLSVERRWIFVSSRLSRAGRKIEITIFGWQRADTDQQRKNFLDLNFETFINKVLREAA